MADTEVPTLEVGFAIAFGDTFADLLRMEGVVDSATANVMKEFAKLERASQGMLNFSGATAQMTSFGNATTREAQSAAAALAKVEKAGEALSRQLDRQIGTFGKSREEIRAMKVEAAALAAEQQNLGELAGRLRAQEASLYAAEYAAMNKAKNEARAAAEDKAEAALRAERAAATEARAVQNAAAAYQGFEAAARAGAAALREQEAAKASAGNYAAKLEAEVAAIGLTTQQLRALTAARRADEAAAAGATDEAARIRAAAAALGEAQAKAEALAQQQRDLTAAQQAAATAAREQEMAQAAQTASLNSLRAAVDPLSASERKLAADLENAARLYRAGAISQDEYGRSADTLAAKLDGVRKAQARQNSASPDAGGGKLRAADMTNIMFQMQDIGVSLAGGQNPFLVLIQQGSQLSGIMAQTGASVGEMAKAVGGLFVTMQPTVEASAGLAAAQSAVEAAEQAAAGASQRAAIAQAELAIENEAAKVAAATNAAAQAALAKEQEAVAAAVAPSKAQISSLATAQTTAEQAAAGLIAAQERMAVAAGRAAGANGVATAAAGTLTGANEALAASADAAARSEKMALTPVMAILAPLAVAAGTAAGAIKLLQNEANDGANMKAYAASLGLTAKEIRNLDDVTVTFGDTTKAVFQVAGAAIWSGIGPAVTKAWGVMTDWLEWLASQVKTVMNYVIGGFVGAFTVISKTWQTFPAVLGDVFYSAVNLAIGAINSLVKKAIDGVNWLGAQANRILPEAFKVPTLSAGQIDKVDNQYAGAAKRFGKTVAKGMTEAMGTDYLGDAASALSKAVTAQARQNARERLRKQAEEKGYLDPEKPKTDKHAEKLARDAAAIEAQIRNLYALADAYAISDAAAMIAEARVKAESQAIKQRADIEAAIDRQLRLSIAQRVADAAKSTAAARDQAAAQALVNGQVAQGLVPAERAAELVRDRMADLPLLTALEVAQQRGLTTEAAKATKVLADQQAMREALRKSTVTAQFNVDQAGGNRQLDQLREELRLVGATDAARARALATLKAEQDARAKDFDPAQAEAYVAKQVEIADAQQKLAAAQSDYNASLTFAADQWDQIAQNVGIAGRNMADAFGRVGDAIGSMAATFADYRAAQARADVEHIQRLKQATSEQAKAREAARYGLATSTMQVGVYGDMASAAKGFFKEGTDGYKALQTAEQAYRAVEFALSVQAMAQDVIETVQSLTNSSARAAADGVAGVAAQSKLPFPFNLAAMAATAVALASIGIAVGGSFGGGGNNLPKSNDGTGTVLGDSTAKSESIQRALESLKAVDTLMLGTSREMAASLKSIDSQMGSFAALLVRSGDISASAGVDTGFKVNTVGNILSSIVTRGGLLSSVPVLGDILGAVGSVIGSLFGTKTSIVGSGLYGDAQSLGSILANGYDAQYYSDIKKKKKTFGVTTSTKYSTKYADADPDLENQFTLILRQFDQAILAAAGPLGVATDTIEQRLNGFVVNIGKIDLKDLSGTEIEEKLTAVFGAAADDMAKAAFPGMEKFQQVGEGLFDTLVRVATTVESVTSTLTLLGSSFSAMGTDLKMALSDQFESVSAMTSAFDSYFEGYYSKEEQAAARTAQFGRVFESLGMVMPDTLAAFRALVDAQDLTTAAGQSAYATLIQLAPAFADLQTSLLGAKSAADIASERQDLERQLLELQGNTAAIRALDLADIDASNRALQEQIWAVQDAQEAAAAAAQLADAWTSVGDSILTEINRIRGISDGTSANSFAMLMGQFNAATAAARGGDQDAAGTLTGLSQSLLTAAANAATSKQELDRVKAQTAASLEETYSVISLLANGGASSTADVLAAAAGAAATSTGTDSGAGDSLIAEVQALRAEVTRLREENNSGHAATAGNTAAVKRHMDNVTAASGGDAISTVQAA